jgi:hypothetical protein
MPSVVPTLTDRRTPTDKLKDLADYDPDAYTAICGLIDYALSRPRPPKKRPQSDSWNL